MKKNISPIKSRLVWNTVLCVMLLVSWLAIGPAPVAYAAPIVVTNTGNSGPGSLRQAITDALSTPADDTITFDVSGTITPASTLPTIISSGGGLTIDGSGQTITISGPTASCITCFSVFSVGSGASLTLNHLTVTKGYASYGGGIDNEGGAVTITNSTFSGNSGSYGGGGIYTFSAATTLRNTIVANSTSGGNCSGSITDGGYNLVWGDSTCLGTNTDPKLLALANNGGPTQTFALDNGSQALEKIPSGTNGCGTTVTTDQRGYARPGTKNDQVNKKCEIGAWEAQATDPTAVTLLGFAARSDPLSPFTGREMGLGIGLALVVCAGLILLGRKRPTSL